eukprot:scaffold27794_cov106-Isochrysis_galbana.AAC.1
MGEGRGSVRTAGGQRSPAMSPLVVALSSKDFFFVRGGRGWAFCWRGLGAGRRRAGASAGRGANSGRECAARHTPHASLLGAWERPADRSHGQPRSPACRVVECRTAGAPFGFGWRASRPLFLGL